MSRILSHTTLIAWVTVAASLLTTAPAEAGKRPPLRIHPKDPLPLETERYLDLEVSLDRGALKVVRVRPGQFSKARLIPRFRGRFQVRLYTRRLLRDVVRFSFPLTLSAGERTRPNIQLDRALARGVRATTKIRVPFPRDVDRALLLDTKLGRRVPIDLAKLLPPPYRPALPAPKRTGIFKPRPE